MNTFHKKNIFSRKINIFAQGADGTVAGTCICCCSSEEDVLQDLWKSPGGGGGGAGIVVEGRKDENSVNKISFAELAMVCEAMGE